MQLPIFGQQQASGDDLNFQDIFADYFNEDIGDQYQYLNDFSEQPGQSITNLIPTVENNRTSWQAGLQSLTPAAKRIRTEENLCLPTAEQTLSYNEHMLKSVGWEHNNASNYFGVSGQNAATSMEVQQLLRNHHLAMISNSSSAKSPLNTRLDVESLGGDIQAFRSGNATFPMKIMNVGLGADSLAQIQNEMSMKGTDRLSMEHQMNTDRRTKNREHAKRSRVRKKFMLESLQQTVKLLQEENLSLRMLVQKHIPQNALKIIADCCPDSPLFGLGGLDCGIKSTESEKTALLKTDFSLIESLTTGQQNFILSDPRLPDNPIVFASPGFYELTGFTQKQVLGRNCRFLQGPGTDLMAVDVIRSAIANGNDATVCLLNYRADGTPFWNHLFVAALRDADNCIVNYVGVLTLVEPNAGASALEDKVNAVLPIKLGQESDCDHEED